MRYLPDGSPQSILHEMGRESPSSIEELQTLLHRGMGRAILYLMDQDLADYRELILDNCLHNYAYDHQFEETRAEYLYPLLCKSGEKGFYRDEIIRALPKETNRYDTEQLLDFAVLFAKDGDTKAREAIYEKLRLNNTDSFLKGSEQVIRLDGAEGLILLFELIGSDEELLAQCKADDSLPDYSIRDAEEQSDIDTIKSALKTATDQNPHIASVLAIIRDYSTDWTAAKIVSRRKKRRKELRRPPKYSAASTWEEIKISPEFERLVYRWPNLASDEEFQSAAKDLASFDDANKLRSYLTLFNWRPFPLAPEPLIRLVDRDDNVAIAALTALELVQHDAVRELFERLINGIKWAGRSIGLLRSNYQTGDNEVIAQFLEDATDPDELHVACIDVMQVYEDNPSNEGLNPLVLVYEKNPCSCCRCTCIERIHEIGDLPEWMTQECLHDAYSRTRELAAQYQMDA